MLKIKFITSIAKVGQNVWDQLAVDACALPFCKYDFLHGLEQSGSVGTDTGWFPQHLVIYQNEQIIGVMPLYKKTHSYGEYIFDFAWANTYRQYGLLYYPKLVTAIPFTPVTGARLMLKSGTDSKQLLPWLCEQLEQHLKQYAMSSMHWLFVDQQMAESLAQHKHVLRRSVQFQWFNKNYTSFDDYLTHMHARRRKSIKKERANVASAGVRLHRFVSTDINLEHIELFYQCYKETYLKKSGHQGYLTESFFKELYINMSQHLMLVIAYQENQPIASALFIFDESQLCGRYWGALTEVNKLHFEVCYYQGIEFCIERNIPQFNPGTQGEHKILRGFEPTYCYSNHKLTELAFHEASERFIKQENVQIAKYKTNAEKLLPFKGSTNAS